MGPGGSGEVMTPRRTRFFSGLFWHNALRVLLVFERPLHEHLYCTPTLTLPLKGESRGPFPLQGEGEEGGVKRVRRSFANCATVSSEQ